MILSFINDLVAVFKDGFGRDISWFLTLVMGMIICNEHLVVASVFYSVLSNLARYESELHFIRPNAVKDEQVWKIRIRKLRSCKLIFELDGQPVLIGDAIKVYEGRRRTPGVKKMHMEFANSASGYFPLGYTFGSVARFLCDGLYARIVCPVCMKFHDCIAVVKSRLERKDGHGRNADSTKSGGEGVKTNTGSENNVGDIAKADTVSGKWDGENSHVYKSDPLQPIPYPHWETGRFDQKYNRAYDRYSYLKSIHLILDLLYSITQTKTTCVGFMNASAKFPGQKSRPPNNEGYVLVNALPKKSLEESTNVTGIVDRVETKEKYIFMNFLSSSIRIFALYR